jgi:hypothetical protein
MPVGPSSHRESQGTHDDNDVPRVLCPTGPMVPFEASDYCTCSLDGQSGTVSIELHGMTSHGWTNGTFIVEPAAPILPTPVDWQRRPAMERSPVGWTGISSRISRSSEHPAIAACPHPSADGFRTERAVVRGRSVHRAWWGTDRLALRGHETTTTSPDRAGGIPVRSGVVLGE